MINMLMDIYYRFTLGPFVVDYVITLCCTLVFCSVDVVALQWLFCSLYSWLHSGCFVACIAGSTVVVLLLVELAPQ